MTGDWRLIDEGEQAYLALRGQGLVLVDVNEIDRAIVSGQTGDVLHRMMEQYRTEGMVDGKLIATYQRSMAGWIMLAGTKCKADQHSRALPISLTPAQDPVLRRSLRLLAMVGELHKAGYQRLRVAAGPSSSGNYWRCSITSSNNIKSNGWEFHDWSDGVANYTTADEDRYFGWADAPGKNARQLAQLFVERFPRIVEEGLGRDRSYCGWFVEMLGRAENGSLPVFFADYDVFHSESEMPPPNFGLAAIEKMDDSYSDDSPIDRLTSQLEAAGEKPILASLTTTTDLLRAHVSVALTRRGQYLDGKIAPADAQSGDVTACHDLADLLMGRGPRIEAFLIQPWNSAELLGQSLVEAYDLPCKPDEAVFTFCLNLLTEIYTEVDDIVQRGLDVAEEGWRLEGVIERYAHAFTGIPYPSDDD